MSALQHAYFVTGTDTEIGKTLVASALINAFAQRGLLSIGMKPIAAGAVLQDGIWQNDDVTMLTQASNVPAMSALTSLINPYLFSLPAAPHIAAQQQNSRIDVSFIVESYQQLVAQSQANVVIVEGVGGFKVPLNDEHDSADMAQLLGLPVILVVGMRLGCISQALLTVEAIAARGLTLAGWVANCPQGEMAYLAENIAALQQRINAPLLGQIPPLSTPEAQHAAQYLTLSLLK